MCFLYFKLLWFVFWLRFYFSFRCFFLFSNSNGFLSDDPQMIRAKKKTLGGIYRWHLIYYTYLVTNVNYQNEFLGETHWPSTDKALLLFRCCFVRFIWCLFFYLSLLCFRVKSKYDKNQCSLSKWFCRAVCYLHLALDCQQITKLTFRF